MEPRVYEEIAAVEESHWWFVTTRQILLDRLLEPGRPGGPVLDAGCGSGAMVRELARRDIGPVIGCDLSPLAFEKVASSAPGRITGADLTRLPFADRSFALITCTDVVEHVEDDRTALSELHRVLIPGGRLGVVVPAFQCLWTEHDRANHHFRRYRLGPLCRLAREVGFTVDVATYINALLGVPMAIYRLAQHLLERIVPPSPDRPPDSDNKPLPGSINALCGRIFQGERRLLRLVWLPFGTSILTVLRR